ncbi:MAG: radical SAM protein [Bacilli bacterium]|nr:radical SAM protein [Bacilli bacterium]
MKIYLKNIGSCDLNYQHNYLKSEISKNANLIDNVADADVIVFTGTCACTELQIISTVNEMIDILSCAKDSVKVYMTGCLTRSFTKDNSFLDKVNRWIRENIDCVVIQNDSNLLLEKLFGGDTYQQYIDFGGIAVGNGYANIYISNGCLNKCSFCKMTYQDYPLKSADLDVIKLMIDYCEQKNIADLRLLGTNISQYGIDNYGRCMLPEIIEYIEQKKGISKVSLIGFAFADAIHNDLGDIIRDSRKISSIGGSLESGSDRILKMMRKGFSSDELVRFINYIRGKHFKELETTILAGFPTETMEDVKLTLDVLKAINPSFVDVCRYIDSTFVDSHKYEQLDPEIIQEHARIYGKVLSRRRIKNVIQGDDYVCNNRLHEYE